VKIIDEQSELYEMRENKTLPSLDELKNGGYITENQLKTYEKIPEELKEKYGKE
jgi:competence protein ComGC